MKYNTQVEEFERLEQIADKYFKSLSNLSLLLGKKKQYLNTYKSRSGFGRKLLSDLENFGISKLYVSHGIGDEFAENEAGRLLREKYYGNRQTAMESNISIIGPVNSEEKFKYLEIGNSPLVVAEPRTEYLPKKLPKNVREVDLTGLFEIDVYSVSAQACKGGLYSFDDLPVSKQTIAIGMRIDQKHLKGLRINGESLAEANIHNGDIAIYDISSEPRNGNIIIALLNGTLLIKRYEKIGEEIFLHSKSSDTKPILVNHLDDELRIMGVVRAILSYV